MSEGQLKISPLAKLVVSLNMNASPDANSAKFTAEINDRGKTIDIQLVMIKLNASGLSSSEK